MIFKRLATGLWPDDVCAQREFLSQGNNHAGFRGDSRAKKICASVRAASITNAHITQWQKMHNSRQTELIKTVRQLLLKYEGVRLVILYGSAVTESFRQKSDIDIAVLFEEPLTPDQKMSLLSELASALRREIDLVDLYKLHGVLLKQILTKGVIVYKQSDHVLYQLLERMIYNQSDFMPLYHREMKNRVEQFING